MPGSGLKKAFERIKRLLIVTPILALFDLNLDTILSADASSFGLEAVLLLQRQSLGELKPVVFISRSMILTEQSYAQIENEMLAYTWACDYLAGHLILLYTD